MLRVKRLMLVNKRDSVASFPGLIPGFLDSWIPGFLDYSSVINSDLQSSSFTYMPLY